jgi:hypothetical protein
MGNLYASYFAHISTKMRVMGDLYTQYFAHISIKMRVVGKIQHFFGQYHDTFYGSQANVLVGKCQHQPR